MFLDVRATVSGKDRDGVGIADRLRPPEAGQRKRETVRIAPLRTPSLFAMFLFP